MVRHAHCPVAVVHDEDPQMQNPAKAPVLVGIDGSPASEAATAIAFEEASLRGVDLVAVHAMSDTDVLSMPGREFAEFEQRGQEVLAERLAGGPNVTPMSPSAESWCGTSPLARWCSNPSTRSWLSWAALTAAAGSPACCWVR